MSAMPIDITPDTKIGKLLDQYPKLEETLIKMSPQFANLRNPLLRKTVGKVATLKQVAKIGEVPLATLINTLRAAAGCTGCGGDTVAEESLPTEAPEWMNSPRIAKTLDARALLARGEHPLNLVLSQLKDLPSGEVFELITPFVPAPLLDIVKGKGFEIYSNSAEPGVVRSYFFWQV